MSEQTLNTLMTLVILPTILAVSGFLIAWLKQKTKEITGNIENAKIRAHVERANELVLNAVQKTFQVYVDKLKEQGKFDAEAQAIAFEKAKNTALTLISQEAKEIIAAVYGDFDEWLAATIETLVRNDKKLTAASAEKKAEIATTAATTAASVAASVMQTAVTIQTTPYHEVKRE